MQRHFPDEPLSLLIATGAVAADSGKADRPAPNSAASSRSQAPAASTASRPADSRDKAEQPSQGGLVDINSASKEELDMLPGVGPARADAIIKHRPYRGKNELVDRNVIPQNVYNDIKDRIIAHQK